MPTRVGKGGVADEFMNICYSQLGEDQIVDHFFSCVKPTENGFYVDVGCHHPKKFSNTFALYLKGWKGICIDADFNLTKLYSELRPRDVFVNSGVADKPGVLPYYIFENAAANTLAPTVKDEFIKKGWKLVEERSIPVRRLDDLLLDHACEKIDYLNIDVEGLDFEVLASFDFTKYKPSLISIETNMRDVSDIVNDRFYDFLKNYGYYPYSHCVISTFFALK